MFNVLEGVIAPSAHRVRTVATISGQTPSAPSQDAPTQTAHRILEKISGKHNTCLATFFFVANESQRLLGGFCSFLEAC